MPDTLNHNGLEGLVVGQFEFDALRAKDGQRS
jgi:hypothetical protein